MKVIPFMVDHIMNRDEAVSIFNDVSEDVTFASLPFPTEPMIMQFNVAYAFPSCGHDYSKVHKLNKAWVDDEGVTHKWLFGRSTQYENSRKQESLKGSKHMFRGVTQMPNRNGPIKLQAIFSEPEVHKVIHFSSKHEAYIVHYFKGSPKSNHHANEKGIAALKYSRCERVRTKSVISEPEKCSSKIVKPSSQIEKPQKAVLSGQKKEGSL